MKGQNSYSSGTKETWRGWQWNRIVDLLLDGRRLGPAGQREFLKDKTVLYLVGPDDKDRECAIKRGFLSENCIAIDIDSGRVSQVRSQGGIAVCGSLHQVLMNWPADRNINVVIADFCHGLTRDAIYLHETLIASPAITLGTVISINMMRGRDSDSNWMRKEMDKLYDGIDNEYRVPLNHRGLILLSHLLAFGVRLLKRSGIGPDEGELWTRNQERVMSPMFYEYKSPESQQVFDSIVFNWPFIRKSTDKNLHAKMKADVSRVLSKRASIDRNIKGKVSATLAVRTTKLRKAGVA